MKQTRTIGVGIIGCGLMGREIASATARFAHLPDMTVQPELVAVCDTNGPAMDWYTDHFDSVRLATRDHAELLADESVEAVYCAVPHNVHQRLYCDIIDAGRHLLAEKPFGIDEPANRAILECAAAHPDVFVRCSSQFPFFPAVQRIGAMLDAGRFGRIIEVNAAFRHSSDLDPDKPINWKRRLATNGAYGCMGDLGMHVCHVPFRAGFVPVNVRAILSNIVTERPDGSGGRAACETWDNATLLCETRGGDRGDRTEDTFPMTLRTQRIAPGQTNTWSIEVAGTSAAARFSMTNPRRLELLRYDGGEQIWGQIDMGYRSAFRAITGGIFEFGFPDAVLQMWAAFLHELAAGGPPSRFAGCVTPEETALAHRLFTSALQSQATGQTIAL